MSERYCPKCKEEMIHSDVHPNAYLCGNCNIIFRKDVTLTEKQSNCKCEEFEFVCKKHGKECKSYVKGIVEDANNEEYILPRFRGLIKYICKNCSKEKKYKFNVEFSNDDKTLIKNFVEEKDLIEDSDMERLKKLRIESQKNNIILSDLFLTCYNYFNGNLYAFYDKPSNLQKKLRDYLYKFKIDDIRELLIKYDDGNQWGSHFKEMDINEYVIKNRSKMDELISLFFECFGSE